MAAGGCPPRRPGDANTRGEILAAARSLFAEHGYDATSLRAVARAADVDPALVHHYFDGKPDLFASSFELPIDPRVLVPRILDGPRDELGQRVAQVFVEVWTGPGAEHLVGILRSALTHEAAAAMLREFMSATLLEGVAGGLDVAQPRTRPALCASHLVGLGVLRQVVGFQPLRDLDDGEFVRWLAPVLQHYLTGPLPG